MTRCSSPKCLHLVKATDGHLDEVDFVCSRDGLPVAIRITDSGVRVAEKKVCIGKQV